MGVDYQRSTCIHKAELPPELVVPVVSGNTQSAIKRVGGKQWESQQPSRCPPQQPYICNLVTLCQHSFTVASISPVLDDLISILPSRYNSKIILLIASILARRILYDCQGTRRFLCSCDWKWPSWWKIKCLQLKNAKLGLTTLWLPSIELVSGLYTFPSVKLLENIWNAPRNVPSISHAIKKTVCGFGMPQITFWHAKCIHPCHLITLCLLQTSWKMAENQLSHNHWATRMAWKSKCMELTL